MIIEKDLKPIDIETLRKNNPIVLIGMPGIAMVGRMAVLNFIKGLEATEYKQIYYYDFPPHAMVGKNGEMTMPKVSLYYWKNNKSGDENANNLIMITADYQPSSGQGIYELSDYICKYCSEINAKYIIALGAFVPEEPVTENRKVYISGSDKDLINFLKASEVGRLTILESGFITGANGIIPAWCNINYNIPGACLLADTLPYPQIDPSASKELVLVLRNRLKVDVNLDFLESKIKQIEKVNLNLKSLLDKKRPPKKPETGYIG